MAGYRTCVHVAGGLSNLAIHMIEGLSSIESTAAASSRYDHKWRHEELLLQGRRQHVLCAYIPRNVIVNYMNSELGDVVESFTT